MEVINESKNGQKLNVGDLVFHLANPDIRGKVIEIRDEFPNYLRSSWVDVLFEKPVEFSGNPGRKAQDWLCSACLLVKI